MRREIEKLKGVIRGQATDMSSLKFKLAQLEFKNSRLLTDSEQKRHELEVLWCCENLLRDAHLE